MSENEQYIEAASTQRSPLMDTLARNVTRRGLLVGVAATMLGSRVIAALSNPRLVFASQVSEDYIPRGGSIDTRCDAVCVIQGDAIVDGVNRKVNGRGRAQWGTIGRTWMTRSHVEAPVGGLDVACFNDVNEANVYYEKVKAEMIDRGCVGGCREGMNEYTIGPNDSNSCTPRVGVCQNYDDEVADPRRVGIPTQERDVPQGAVVQGDTEQWNGNGWTPLYDNNPNTGLIVKVVSSSVRLRFPYGGDIMRKCDPAEQDRYLWEQRAQMEQRGCAGHRGCSEGVEVKYV